jgi:hypothetical protein
MAHALWAGTEVAPGSSSAKATAVPTVSVIPFDYPVGDRVTALRFRFRNWDWPGFTRAANVTLNIETPGWVPGDSKAVEPCEKFSGEDTSAEQQVARARQIVLSR